MARPRPRSAAKVTADKERLGQLKDMLEEKRREVMGAIKRSRMTGMEVRGESIPEMGDFVSASVEKEHVFERGQTGVETLREVEDALVRLKEGTYGVCACCGHGISITRLRAIPFARLCVACQENEERGLTG